MPVRPGLSRKSGESCLRLACDVLALPGFPDCFSDAFSSSIPLGMKQIFCIFWVVANVAILGSCAEESTTGTSGTLPTMTAPEHGPEYPSKTNYGRPGGM